MEVTTYAGLTVQIKASVLIFCAKQLRGAFAACLFSKSGSVFVFDMLKNVSYNYLTMLLVLNNRSRNTVVH